MNLNSESVKLSLVEELIWLFNSKLPLAETITVLTKLIMRRLYGLY
jgi:hypothetical protein